MAIANCDPDDLVRLLGEIFERLPQTKLKGIDLGRELLVQHAVMKSVQNELLDDESVPANQLAQVGNSVSANIAKLVKLQTEQYTSERFKQIEIMLIELLNTWPKDQTRDFFAQYEKIGA